MKSSLQKASQMFRKYIIGFLVFLFSTTAIANSQTAANMLPTHNELLTQPISLSCGVTIREWHGESAPNKQTIKELNTLCHRGLVSFSRFLSSKKLKAPHSGTFSWNWALLPDGSCYRCMNDIAYRFNRRFIKAPLWGYTGRNERFTFTVSDLNLKSPKYNKIFVHELFHAMSMYYGLYDTHAPNDVERTMKDEALAKQFTQYMGY